MSPQPDLLQRRGLKLSHLRLLAQLAETGQIGQTAAQLGTSQPAASRLLAEVERIVGQPVHERTGRGVVLTAAGLALARRAQRIQLEMRDAAEELADLSGGNTGHVRVGAVTAPALDLVLPALRTARLAYPRLTAEVTVAPSDTLCAQLLGGQIDFSIGRIPPGIDPALFDFRPIGEEPVAFVVRRGHHLLNAGPGAGAVTARDLLDYDWVLPGGGNPMAAAVMARLTELGLPSPPQRLSTASFLLTLAVVQQTNSIAPLSRAVADRFAGAPDAPYGVVPVDLGVTVPSFGLVTRRQSQMPPAAQRLANLILSVAGLPALPDTAAT